MNCFLFSREPSGAAYRELVTFCCATASRMLLVARDPDTDPGERIRRKLKELEAFATDTFCAKEWPGTILHTDEATIYMHNASPALGEKMLEITTRLFEWIHPEAPEDPCFLRENGEPVLVTTSHEGDAYMMLSEAEFSEIERLLPDLAMVLRRE
jgi:hypothetical protein